MQKIIKNPLWVLIASLLFLGACADSSSAKSADGCYVTQNEDGSATITCPDGSETTLGSPQAGADGSSCTVDSLGDGWATISCDDGTQVTFKEGSDGSNCTV